MCPNHGRTGRRKIATCGGRAVRECVQPFSLFAKIQQFRLPHSSHDDPRSDMSSDNSPERAALRAEIAAAAARLIAEDGADYGTAKRKAVKQILGDSKVKGNILPDNAQIEDEVRAYNELFFSETQPARLLHLRRLALRMMNELQAFSPYLTGAVLNGTAGEHSDIHLQLFVDSPKDVEIFLLGKDVDFEVSETAHFNGRSGPVETISFMWQNEGIHLALYERDDLRGAVKGSAAGRMERANSDQVTQLIKEQSPE
jgi:predicted heme/steroid binding protein